MKYHEFKQSLGDMPREHLEAAVLNNKYNDFCSRWCDDDNTTNSPNGKRIPYWGWFWREVNFYAGRVTIGFEAGYVGFMENNKWGYAQRDLTPDEFVELMALIDEARRLSGQGGLMSEINASVNAQLKKLYEWMQARPMLNARRDEE